mgnify:CR=1 FL=1
MNPLLERWCNAFVLLIVAVWIAAVYVFTMDNGRTQDEKNYDLQRACSKCGAVPVRGFVLTGTEAAHDLSDLNLHPHETSVPGLFAVGDVRAGSVKRVAGAVGEGSVAVGSVHRYLAEAG